MSATAELDREYAATESGCGVIDRSERGKLAFSGDEAKAFLQGQVTNDVESLTEGSGCYAALLTAKGKMLADLRVLDRGDELLIDTERSALQDLFTVLYRHRIGYAVEVHKRTLERGLISLLGPRARELADCPGLGPEEHANAKGALAGRPVVFAATDLGVDVICEAGDTEELLVELRERGAVEISEAVAECRRVEVGRPRYGVDLDDSVIPQEAGLNERAVSFTKGCYVGQETVARLFYKGKPNRHLRGLRLEQPVAPGGAIRLGERDVGRVSSVAHSPRFGTIALALVRREAAVGDAVRVGEDGIAAQIAELPFA